MVQRHKLTAKDRQRALRERRIQAQLRKDYPLNRKGAKKVLEHPSLYPKATVREAQRKVGTPYLNSAKRGVAFLRKLRKRRFR